MKTSDKNRAILAEAIARSWREPNFRQQFTSNPKQTLKEAGMDISDDHEVDVVENTDNLVNAVLPEMSQMDSHDADVAFNNAVSRLRNMPENIEVRIMRDSKNKSHVILPMIPTAAAIGEMSDADLEQIAGGKASTATYEAEVQTTFEVTTAETTSEVGGEVIAVAVAAVVLT